MIFYVKLKILYIYSNVEYANFSSLLVFLLGRVFSIGWKKLHYF